MPSEDLWPEGSATAGHLAVETKFLSCEDDECDVQVAGARVPLQRATLYVPPGGQASGAGAGGGHGRWPLRGQGRAGALASGRPSNHHAGPRFDSICNAQRRVSFAATRRPLHPGKDHHASF
jgi:hypothetical protein